MLRARSHASFSGALAALLLLAGCTTAPETAPTKPAAPANQTGPVAPVTPNPATKSTAPVTPTAPAAPVIELRPATILGSEETSAMFDNFTAYIQAVDGQVVAFDRNGWNTPVTVKSGVRRLTIVFIRGVFTAQTEVLFTARPGAAYQLKFATDAQIFGKNSYCDFWIEDIKSGVKTLETTRVPLVRVEKPN